MDEKNPTFTHPEDLEKSESSLSTSHVEISQDAHHKNAAEKRLVRKMDFTIVPMLFLSFFIAYLVRY